MAFVQKKLTMALKKQWFEAVKNGSKKYEIRPCTPYWEKRLSKSYDVIVFTLGYPKRNDLKRMVSKEFVGIKNVSKQELFELVSVEETAFIQKTFPHIHHFFLIVFDEWDKDFIL